MSATVFSPELLDQFDFLKTSFFSGNEELSKINRFSREELVKPERELYFDRWSITWVVITFPFKLIYFIFLRAIASICACLKLPSLSNSLYLQGTYATKEIEFAWTQFTYGRRLVVPTFNEVQLGLSDVYDREPIKRSDIQNSLIKKKLHPLLNKISFNRIGKGICHGSVHWFNFLFLKSWETNLQDRVDTIWQYLSPIAKLFENGHPRQAALMQSLYGLKNDLLDLHEVRICALPKDLTNRSEVLEAIKHLEEGCYALEISKHVISYIKTNGEECVWDPNKGLVIIEKAEDLLDFLLYYTRDKEKSSICFVKHLLEEPQQFYFFHRLFARVFG